MKKLKLRRERTWHDRPPVIGSGAYEFRIENITAARDRVNHWPGYSTGNNFYEWEEEDPENCPEYIGSLGDNNCICLKDINALIKEYNFDEKDVFFTASFSNDYLNIEVVHVKKQNEQEQLENYNQEDSNWAKRNDINKEEELLRIQQDISSLQRRLKDLIQTE